MQDEGRRERGTDAPMAGLPKDIVVFEPRSVLPGRPIVSMHSGEGVDDDSDGYEEIGIRIEQRNDHGKVTTVTEVRKRFYDPQQHTWATRESELLHLLQEATHAAPAVEPPTPGVHAPRRRGPQGEFGDPESLVRLVRSSLLARKRDDMRMKHEDTATDLGISCRTLKRACKFHHLDWWPWPPRWAGQLS